MFLEQMYLIPTLKILVLAPNCWETMTEFSRHNSHTWTVRLISSENWVIVTRKFGSYMMHYRYFI